MTEKRLLHSDVAEFVPEAYLELFSSPHLPCPVFLFHLSIHLLPPVKGRTLSPPMISFFFLCYPGDLQSSWMICFLTCYSESSQFHIVQCRPV